MTPSIEERIQQLGITSRTHDAMLNLLITISERQQDTLDRQQGLLDRQQSTLERQEEILQEIRRDARQTQRLWVRLAQRHGWLEDDDLFTE